MSELDNAIENSEHIEQFCRKLHAMVLMGMETDQLSEEWEILLGLGAHFFTDYLEGYIVAQKGPLSKESYFSLLQQVSQCVADILERQGLDSPFPSVEQARDLYNEFYARKKS